MERGGARDDFFDEWDGEITNLINTGYDFFDFGDEEATARRTLVPLVWGVLYCPA